MILTVREQRSNGSIGLIFSFNVKKSSDAIDWLEKNGFRAVFVEDGLNHSRWAREGDCALSFKVGFKPGDPPMIANVRNTLLAELMRGHRLSNIECIDL